MARTMARVQTVVLAFMLLATGALGLSLRPRLEAKDRFAEISPRRAEDGKTEAFHSAVQLSIRVIEEELEKIKDQVARADAVHEELRELFARQDGTLRRLANHFRSLASGDQPPPFILPPSSRKDDLPIFQPRNFPPNPNFQPQSFPPNAPNFNFPNKPPIPPPNSRPQNIPLNPNFQPQSFPPNARNFNFPNKPPIPPPNSRPQNIPLNPTFQPQSFPPNARMDDYPNKPLTPPPISRNPLPSSSSLPTYFPPNAQNDALDLFFEPPQHVTEQTTVKGECLNGWERHGARCYKLATEPETWYQAERECWNLGRRLRLPVTLPIIRNPGEQGFLASKAKKLGGSLLLGLTDRDQEGTWKWLDGSSGAKDGVGYTWWGPNEPNDKYGFEDCAVLRHTGDNTWNDISCTDKFRFFCQYEYRRTSKPAIERVLESGSSNGAGAQCRTGWERYGDSCYWINIKARSSWARADTRCRDFLHQEGVHAHLAIIRNQGEQTFLAGKARKLGAPLWIGLFDRQTEGTWKWMDGTSGAKGNGGYTNWAPNEPNDYKPEEKYTNYYDCAELRQDHRNTWRDQLCQKKRRFVCQYELTEAVPENTVKSKYRNVVEAEEESGRVTESLPLEDADATIERSPSGVTAKDDAVTTSLPVVDEGATVKDDSIDNADSGSGAVENASEGQVVSTWTGAGWERKQTIPAGKRLELDCQDKNPGYIYSWHLDPRDLSLSYWHDMELRLRSDEGRLTIDPVKVGDSGTYTCRKDDKDYPNDFALTITYLTVVEADDTSVTLPTRY